LNKKSLPNKHPRWREPGKGPAKQESQANGSAEHTQSPSNNCGVESFRISETFVLIRTPDGEYYGEFHGEFNDPDFPEELLGDGTGNNPDSSLR
jgi:hypothetical protein